MVGGERGWGVGDIIKIPFPSFLYFERVIKGNCRENMCNDLLYNDPGWLFDSGSLRGISRFLTTYKSNYKNDSEWHFVVSSPLMHETRRKGWGLGVALHSRVPFKLCLWRPIALSCPRWSVGETKKRLAAQTSIGSALLCGESLRRTDSWRLTTTSGCGEGQGSLADLDLLRFAL